MNITRVFYIKLEHCSKFMEDRIEDEDGSIREFSTKDSALRFLFKEVDMKKDFIYSTVEGYVKS